MQKSAKKKKLLPRINRHKMRGNQAKTSKHLRAIHPNVKVYFPRITCQKNFFRHNEKHDQKNLKIPP